MKSLIVFEFVLGLIIGGYYIGKFALDKNINYLLLSIVLTLFSLIMLYVSYRIELKKAGIK